MSTITDARARAEPARIEKDTVLEALEQAIHWLEEEDAMNKWMTRPTAILKRLRAAVTVQRRRLQ